MISDMTLAELKEELQRAISAGARQRGDPFDRVNKVWQHELKGAIAYLEHRGLTGTLNESFGYNKLKQEVM